MSHSRLILLPGLAADERMYAPLRATGIDVETPRLLIPFDGEVLGDYAGRTAAELDVGAHDIIGGSSFGGLVAATIARQRPVAGLVLIGSTFGASGLGSAGRLFGGLLHLLPFALVGRVLTSDKAMARMFGIGAREDFAIARTMFYDTPRQLIDQGSWMLRNCRETTPPDCPVFAIHGALDRVLSPPPVDCTIIPDAGHGLPFTHPRQLADFLRTVQAKLW
ncbi:MAG: alpha/beta hydrolase [Desulfuromonadales bacterium]|nr:alpha/beta hydrolase [Desulfuromonadales bacterium]